VGRLGQLRPLIMLCCIMKEKGFTEQDVLVTMCTCKNLPLCIGRSVFWVFILLASSRRVICCFALYYAILRCVERTYMYHGSLRRIVVIQEIIIIIIIIIATSLKTADIRLYPYSTHLPSPPHRPAPKHLHLHIPPSPITPLRPPHLSRRSLLQ
jgi:hypothetical protein